MCGSGQTRSYVSRRHSATAFELMGERRIVHVDLWGTRCAADQGETAIDAASWTEAERLGLRGLRGGEQAIGQDVSFVESALEAHVRGYNIGTRLIEDFLARTGLQKCSSFAETAEVVSKVRAT